MLTELLSLVSSLCLLQDVSPPPPAEPPATEAAPAVPTETSDSVRSFLMEAESQLYDPQAAGLQSLAFDLPMEVPQLGHVGVVHVSWSAGSEPSMTVETAAGLSLPPQIPVEALDMLGKQSAGEFLSAILNRPISPMLTQSVATMAPPQDGMVKVNFSSEVAAAQGVKEQALLFDGDGLLQQQVLVVEAPSPFGGTMTVPIQQVYTWKPVREGSDLLVIDMRSTVADMGIITQKSEDTYSRRAVADLILTTAIITKVDGAPPLGGTKTVAARNLVVNGEPVPDEPSTTPDATAPAVPHGG